MDTGTANMSMTLRASDVRKAYDGRAAKWDSIKSTFTLVEGEDNRLKQLVLERVTRLGGNGYPEMIDFGCGNGRLLEQAMNLVKVGRFVGIDHSLCMLLEANRRLNRITMFEGLECGLIGTGAATTPLPDNAFDLTSAKLVLHHVQQPRAILQEMHRVTKPNGYVYVLVPGPGYQRAYRHGDGQWRSTEFPPKMTCGNHDPLGRFTVDELKDLARQVGLRRMVCYADEFVYRFQTIADYFDFMGQNGADAKLRTYQFDQLNWAEPYRGILSGFVGPLDLECEFITLEARKDVV